MLIMLGRDNEAIDWLEEGIRAYKGLTPTQIAERETWDTVIEDTKATLAAAYALAGRLDDAHMMLASAMSSDRMMDFTVRVFLNSIPVYFDEHRHQQEKRIAEGLRRAGLRDHLDERADFHAASAGYLRDAVNTPTPTAPPSIPSNWWSCFRANH